MKSRSRSMKSRISRRGFLRTGALGTGAAAGLASCGSREEQLIPLLVPEESFIPGTDRWAPGTCTLCPAGCGLLARTMLGEARVRRGGREYRQMAVQVKKVEGNPAHPVNLGRLCARGQALPQHVYHPDRIRTPMKRSRARGSGEYQPISWDEALALFESKLEPLLVDGAASGLAAVAGEPSSARAWLLADFFRAAGSDRLVIRESPGMATQMEANRRLYGRSECEVHDLENTRYLLSFGAGFLESHSSPVRYALGLASLRGSAQGRKARFVHVEGRMSLTAAQADEWLPARPGTEGALALAMAHVILKEGLFDEGLVRTKTTGFSEFREWVLRRYSPETIAGRADVPVEKIIRIAREFARYQPGLAIAGGGALAHSHGLFNAVAVQSLNVLAGSQGRAGGFSWTDSGPANPSRGVKPIVSPADRLNGLDSVQLLILWDADPIHGSPASSVIREKIEGVPFIVSCTTMPDDTSIHADLILPDQTSLEKWDLIRPRVTRGNRINSICQPVIKPAAECRDFGDVLLSLAARIGGKLHEALPQENFRDYLKHRLESADVLRRGSFSADDIDSYWDKLIEEGFWFDASPPARIETASLSALRDLEPDPTAGEDAVFPLHLQPFASPGLGFGRSAHLPLLQELPDPTTSLAWGSWVEINPRTAAGLNIHEGELVRVESKHGSIRVPALLSQALRPDTVSIPFGQGHHGYGRYAAGRGANPWEVIAPVRVQGADDWAWAATRVRIQGTGRKGRLIKVG